MGRATLGEEILRKGLHGAVEIKFFPCKGKNEGQQGKKQQELWGKTTETNTKLREGQTKIKKVSAYVPGRE